jgi:hypothetical protein
MTANTTRWVITARNANHSSTRIPVDQSRTHTSAGRVTVIPLDRSMEVNVKVVRIIRWVLSPVDVCARGSLKVVDVTRVSMDTGICERKIQTDVKRVAATLLERSATSDVTNQLESVVASAMFTEDSATSA